MCKGFGGIATKDGKLYFTEPDNDGDCSHTTVLERLKIKDSTDVFNRNFIRWQFPNWKAENFAFDEEDTLPGWAEGTRDEIRNRAMTLLGKVQLAWAEYDKVEKLALAEYKIVRQSAFAEYEKAKQPAFAEYEKVEHPAFAEYEKAKQPAFAEYEKAKQPARAEFIVQLSKYPEYVKGDTL